MNFKQKAFDLLKLIDYDIYKEALEGECDPLLEELADHIENYIYDVGYDKGYADGGGI